MSIISPKDDSNSKQTSDILSNQEKEKTINSISSNLLSTYVFPNIAKEMSDFIIKNFIQGNYHSINNPYDFANRLREDLLSISKDKHVRVTYNPEEIAAEKLEEKDRLEYQTDLDNRLKRENFGFKELKILSGNIGYLDLTSFPDVEDAGETAVAAMNFLSNSDAIIFDLRMNGGGDALMTQLISSYLFSTEPVHLSSFYWRPTDSHSQTWTLPYVQGNRFPETAVYILASKRTFSAAEEFIYNLKNLKRATIIGETTGGGAHPGGPVNATDKFTINIPCGRAINPITNTNWEGTGIAPHIEVSSCQALEVAHVKALETLIENSEDQLQKEFYDWNLIGLNARLEPRTIDATILESYAGTYGPIKVFMKGNVLYYKQSNSNYRQGKTHESELIPLTENEFLSKNHISSKTKFIVENGQTVALEIHYEYGGSLHRELKNKE